MRPRGQSGIGIELSALPHLDADELHNVWRRLHHRPPPKALVGDLLIRVLAHDLQVAAFGGFSPATKACLKHAVQDAQRDERGAEPKEGARSSGGRYMKPGTRLLRQWQGADHEVVVVPDGFLWDGKVHRSLSTIARLITGTVWNGWTFFGVTRSKGREAADA